MRQIKEMKFLTQHCLYRTFNSDYDTVTCISSAILVRTAIKAGQNTKQLVERQWTEIKSAGI